MRIMVFDVPAESGGALSVLHEFYNEFKLNQENEYIFVLSLPELKETSNIKVLRFPWIKKSWGHRIYFDRFIAPKLIKEYKVDKVLSLQNITIPNTKVYQSVFVHNALPFTEYEITIKENKKLWVYQNIIGKNIMKSIERADHVIVQTNWMKKKCIEQLKVSREKIEVKPPKIDIEVKERFKKTKESMSTFFYPANGAFFKNHKVIVEACLMLKEEGVSNYKVIFTLEGNENKHIVNLFNVVERNNLPIEFIGSLKRDEVFDFYTKSTLIFPSYIETVGLPLLEAKMYYAPILSTESDYAYEILDGYKEVHFFNPFDPNFLKDVILAKIKD
ncbi:MAG: glycosyltransferase [Firmicutes bacterium]|nr:glycosyltransferase [Bacillota bacterium]